MSKSLPVDKISNADFNGEFKGTYLDKKVLGPEDIKAIRELFGLDKGSEDNRPYDIYCDEAHSHGYSCLRFNHPAAGVVKRLLLEIEHYKSRLSSIRALTHNGSEK